MPNKTNGRVAQYMLHNRSNFFLKAGTGHVPLWPYRGSVDIRKQTLINMTLTSDPQLYFTTRIIVVCKYDNVILVK